MIYSKIVFIVFIEFIMDLFTRLALQRFVRDQYPEVQDNLEVFLEEHSEIREKTEKILYIVLYSIIFINLCVCIPWMLFNQYCSHYCTWDIAHFNYIMEIIVIILSILLITEIIICKINFKIIKNKKSSERIKRIPLVEFMGKSLTAFVFFSIMFYITFYITEIHAPSPIQKEHIMDCSANISQDSEILFDTREKKKIRINQTKKYTNNIANNYLNYWTPPKVEKEKSVDIIVRISKDGKLLKYEIEESSKIEQFDKSAIDVVKSVKTFEPLPESIKTEYIDFMFAFGVFKQKKYVKEYQNLCKTCQNPYKDDETLFYIFPNKKPAM